VELLQFSRRCLHPLSSPATLHPAYPSPKALLLHQRLPLSLLPLRCAAGSPSGQAPPPKRRYHARRCRRRSFSSTGLLPHFFPQDAPLAVHGFDPRLFMLLQSHRKVNLPWRTISARDDPHATNRAAKGAPPPRSPVPVGESGRYDLGRRLDKELQVNKYLL
jgi:hypothetical protein